MPLVMPGADEKYLVLMDIGGSFHKYSSAVALFDGQERIASIPPKGFFDTQTCDFLSKLKGRASICVNLHGSDLKLDVLSLENGNCKLMVFCPAGSIWSPDFWVCIAGSIDVPAFLTDSRNEVFFSNGFSVKTALDPVAFDVLPNIRLSVSGQKCSIGEEALEVLRQTCNAIASPAMVTDCTGSVAVFNKECQLLTGYSESQVLSKPVSRLPFASGKAVEPSLKNTQSCWFSIDGSIVNIDWDASDLDIDGARLKLWIGRHSSRHLMSAIQGDNNDESPLRIDPESLGFRLFTVGLDGRFLYVNNSFCSLIEYDRNDLRGMHFNDVFVKPEFEEIIQAHLDKGILLNYESPGITKFGISIPCRINICLARAGNDPALFCIASDLTEGLISQATESGKSRLVDRIAKFIISIATMGMDNQMIQKTIGDIGEILDVDRIKIIKLPQSGSERFTLHAQWKSPLSKSEDFFNNIAADDFKLFELNRALEKDFVYSEEDFSEKNRMMLGKTGIKSLYIAPLFVGMKLWGIMSFASDRIERKWLDWEKNAIKSMCSTISAIMEHEIQSQKIRSFDEKLEITVNIIPDAVAIINISKGRLELLNDCFKGILGVSDANEFDPLRGFLKNIKLSGSGDIIRGIEDCSVSLDEEEVIFHDTSGNRRSGLMTTRIIAVGGEQLMILSLKDITDLVESIEIARENKALASKTFSINPDPAIIFDETDVTSANSSFHSSFGYDESLIDNRKLKVSDLIGFSPTELFSYCQYDGSAKNIPVLVTSRNGRRLDCLASIERITHSGRIQYYCVFHDISEIILLQERLRESLERYEKLTEAVQDGIFVLYENMKLIYVNQAAEMMTGYNKIELLTMDPLQLFFQQDREIFVETFKQCLSQKTLLPANNARIVKKNGETAVWNYKITTDIIDGIDSVIVTVSDVTELVTAKEKLEKSNTILQTILDTLHDNFYVKDLDGRFTFYKWSKMEEKGFTPDKYIGKTIIEVEPYSPDYPERESKRVFCQTTGQKVSYLRHFKTDLIDTMLEVTLAPMRNSDGDVTGVIGVGRNITEEFTAKRKAYELEKRFKIIAQTITDIIFQVEGNEIKYVSPSVFVYGFSQENLIGLSIQTLFGHEFLKYTIEKGYHNFEIEMKDPNRIKHYFEIRIFSDDNGIIGVARNISERKNFEKAKRHFLRSVAHEMRNPLTLILGYSELLMNSSADNPEINTMATIINDAAENERKRLNEFFDLDKATIEYSFDVTNCANVLFSICTKLWMLVSKTARNKHNTDKSTFANEIDPQLKSKSISVDYSRFSEIFENLAVNSVKYSNPDNIAISFNAVLNGSFLEIRFSDKGIGIPEGETKKIFKPFYQIKSGKADPDGLGLGLANVIMHVEAHGGSISVYSVVGEGTTFTLSFPLYV